MEEERNYVVEFEEPQEIASLEIEEQEIAHYAEIRGQYRLILPTGVGWQVKKSEVGEIRELES